MHRGSTLNPLDQEAWTLARRKAEHIARLDESTTMLVPVRKWPSLGGTHLEESSQDTFDGRNYFGGSQKCSPCAPAEARR